MYSKILFGIALICFVLFLLINGWTFLSNPPVWPDEAVYADSARHLLATGHLATNLFLNAVPGIQQSEEWYPPFYFYVLSFWMWIVGQGITSIRFLSFVIGIGCLGLYILLVKEFLGKWSYAWMGFVLLLLDASFNTALKIARMDILTLFFFILSLWLYLLAQKKERKWWYVATGVSLTLGVLTHPLGMIACISIGLFAICRDESLSKKILHLQLLFLPVCIGVVFWIVSIFPYFSFFLPQYQAQWVKKASESFYVFILLENNIAYWFLFLCYGILAVILGYLSFVKRVWKALFCFIGLLVSVIILTWGKEIWYILFFQPFTTLGLLTSFYIANEQKNKAVKIGAISALVIYCVFSLHTSFSQVIQQIDKNYESFSQAINKKIPNNSSVFITTIPDPYFSLSQRKNIILFEQIPETSISKKAYTHLLDSSDYIVINAAFDKRIEEYIKKNSEETDSITQGGYNAYIVKLLPKNKRH